ncbi:MAG TPA: hypothetical protein VKP11_05840 [Frankiaceae bacterium]|nr:hypothetical protein [Frankiaceae bacterium]
MRRPVLPLAGRCLLVAVLAVSFVGAGAAAADQRPRGAAPVRAPVGGEGGPARVEVLHLFAPGGTRPREVWVYRPAVSDGPDLPVLYSLHRRVVRKRVSTG